MQRLEQDKELSLAVARLVSPALISSLGRHTSVPLQLPGKHGGPLTRHDVELAWEQADRDKDGALSFDEFARYITHRHNVSLSMKAAEKEAARAPPTTEALWALALQAGLPFVAFGFMDNFIMITAGSALENRLGMIMALSTMAAAGLGNAVSDVIGVWSGNIIENGVTKLGLKPHGLTLQQLKLSKCRWVIAMSSALGITIGCILGLVPLLWIDTAKAQLREIFSELDADGDGFVDVTELEAAIHRLGLKIDRDTLHDTLSRLDTDHNGRIDFDEFSQVVSRWRASNDGAAR